LYQYPIKIRNFTANLLLKAKKTGSCATIWDNIKVISPPNLKIKNLVKI